MSAQRITMMINGEAPGVRQSSIRIFTCTGFIEVYTHISVAVICQQILDTQDTLDK